MILLQATLQAPAGTAGPICPDRLGTSALQTEQDCRRPTADKRSYLGSWSSIYATC
jgi:hypothetical protein